MKALSKLRKHKKTYLFYYWIYWIIFLLANIIAKIFKILSINNPDVICIIFLWAPLMILWIYEGVQVTTFFDCNENDEYIMKFKNNYNLLFYPIKKISSSSLKKVLMEVRELCKLAIVVMLTIVALWMMWAI